MSMNSRRRWIERSQQRRLADAEYTNDQRVDAAMFGKALFGRDDLGHGGALDCLGGGAGPERPTPGECA